MKKFISIVLLIGMIAGGCKEGPKLVSCNFDEQTMLTNYADNIIIPRFKELKASLLELQTAVNAFNATPTATTLNDLRASFSNAYLNYEDCGTFAFGPGLINGVPFRERMNTFPVDENGVNENVQNGILVSNASKAEVGFPSIGYLIFGSPSTTDSDLIDLFTVDANAEKRKSYLLAMVTEMTTVSSQIVLDWVSYRSTFIASTGTADGSSVSLLLNQINFDFETLKNFKFKIPLGKFNGGIVVPASVEGYYSGLSMQLATRQIVALSNFYQGIGENKADNLGLHEYMICLDTKYNDELLADTILSQFESIKDAFKLIADPLSQTLLSNKAAVETAYKAMQEMVPLIKYEMTTAMGVQINYQDSDGD
ncbi:imelysin family protein [Bacteroidota bacterium]